MTRKPFAAFGRILYVNYYDEGEVFNLTTYADSRTTLFFSEGSLTARNVHSQEVVYECLPGWYRGQYEDRNLVCTVNKDSQCWCYDPVVNQGFLPQISPFIMKAGDSIQLNSNTNLFLCGGNLSIDGRTFTGPYQLIIKSEGKTATAENDIYGLVFR